MSNTTNIPTGLNVQTQIPLDTIKFIQNESLLSNLGASNNLAFKYYDGLTIRCIDENTFYIWREVLPGEENTGLLSVDFTYPYNHSAFGINYSNKSFNFFQIEYVSVDDIITYTGTNIGNGSEILKDITGTSTKTFNFKKINSDNLTIIDNGDDLTINTPMTASIPALYVNNLYVPTYSEWLTENKIQNGGTAVTGFVFRGKGSLAQPFTDSTVYPLLGGSATITTNTAIQNALDGDTGVAYTTKYSYQGTGTRLAPNRVGEKIIVQDNILGYSFAGNFGYSRINIELSANVGSTTTGYLVDMDNATHFNALNDRANITVAGGYILGISGDGFNNSGTNVATFLEAQSRSIILKGGVTSVTNDINKYIINSDITSTGNNNDGSLTFLLDGDIYAEKQGLIRIGGVSRVWNYGKMQSSNPGITINTGLKAYLFLGGQFRSFIGSTLNFAGVRTDAFVFTPTGGFTPVMVGQSVTIVSLGTITNLFNKTNTNTANLNFSNSDSSVSFVVTNIFESPNVWSVIFNKNIFESGIIDPTKADLTAVNTVSATNQIGGNLIENLRIFDNRSSAILAGVPLYSAYIKTNENAYPSTSTWVRDIVLPA